MKTIKQVGKTIFFCLLTLSLAIGLIFAVKWATAQMLPLDNNPAIQDIQDLHSQPSTIQLAINEIRFAKESMLFNNEPLKIYGLERYLELEDFDEIEFYQNDSDVETCLKLAKYHLEIDEPGISQKYCNMILEYWPEEPQSYDASKLQIDMLMWQEEAGDERFEKIEEFIETYQGHEKLDQDLFDIIIFFNGALRPFDNARYYIQRLQALHPNSCWTQAVLAIEKINDPSVDMNSIVGDLRNQISPHLQKKCFLALGNYCESFDQPKRTLQFYKTLAKLYPNNLKVRCEVLNQVLLIGRLKRFDSLLGKFYEDFETRQKFPIALSRLAQTCFEYNKNKIGENLCYDLVESWPNSSQAQWAHTQLALFFIEKRNGPKAQEHVDALWNNDIDGEVLVDGIMKIANAYQQSHQYQKAINSYEDVLEVWPDHPSVDMAQVQCANCFYALGQDRMADNILYDLIGQDDEPEGYAELFNGVADELLQTKHFEVSNKLFSFTLRQWPEGKWDIQAKTGLAMSAIELGDDSPANQFIDEMIQSNCDAEGCDQAMFLIGEQFAYKGRDVDSAGEDPNAYYTRAIEEWKRVIEYFPGTAASQEACQMMADNYFKRGHYQKALDCYRQSLEHDYQDDMNWNVHFLLGYTYQALKAEGIIDESIANLQTRNAYEYIIKSYPNCQASFAARHWLSLNKY